MSQPDRVETKQQLAGLLPGLTFLPFMVAYGPIAALIAAVVVFVRRDPFFDKLASV